MSFTLADLLKLAEEPDGDNDNLKGPILIDDPSCSASASVDPAHPPEVSTALNPIEQQPIPQSQSPSPFTSNPSNHLHSLATASTDLEQKPTVLSITATTLPDDETEAAEALQSIYQQLPDLQKPVDLDSIEPIRITRATSESEPQTETVTSMSTPRPTIKALRQQRKNTRRRADREEKRRQGESKPANAFMLYRRDRSKEISQKYREERNGEMVTLGFADVSRLCGKLWRSETQHVRDAYSLAATKLAKEHRALSVKRKLEEEKEKKDDEDELEESEMEQVEHTMVDLTELENDLDFLKWQEFYSQHV
ncbi:UNVERIFIED_CONTAM: hypothetical protein HDU68_001042 [Siphonaria sp. JEL0065]|nr:hypothetical protein HDU68_001042 [Siphonaria sp. JEL0065]